MLHHISFFCAYISFARPLILSSVFLFVCLSFCLSFLSFRNHVRTSSLVIPGLAQPPARKHPTTIVAKAFDTVHPTLALHCFERLGVPWQLLNKHGHNSTTGSTPATPELVTTSLLRRLFVTPGLHGGSGRTHQQHLQLKRDATPTRLTGISSPPSLTIGQ